MMALLAIAVFGAAIFGNSFFKFGFGPMNIFIFLILCCLLSYFVVFLQGRGGRHILQPSPRSDRWLWAFFTVGVIVVALSYLGFYDTLPAKLDLLYDKTYIPRQAYYLFFIPLIIIAGRNSFTHSTISLIARHRVVLFYMIYILHILYSKSFAIDVPCCFALGVLLVFGANRHLAIDLPMIGILVLSPIAVGGEMTQIIIRILAIVFYAIRYRPTLLHISICGMLIVIIACYILPFMPLDKLGFDANTLWRAQYWGDELSLLAKTWGIGVGYGTSYASSGFVGSAVSGPFAATAQYTVTERIFVVGCHNSFVSLFFRLGILGIVTLLGYLFSLAKNAYSIRGGVCVFGCLYAYRRSCNRLL